MTRAGGTFYILIFILCCLPMFFNAQKKWMLRASAEEAMLNKDWYAAQQYYFKLYKRDSSGIKIKYDYAEACRLNLDVDQALKFYTKVAVADNGKKYPLALYWLAQVLKNKQQYKEAKKWFVKFNKLELSPSKYNYYINKGKLEEEACDLAQILINNPLHIESDHPGAPINTKSSEYAAFERDSVVYFSSLRVASDNSELTRPEYNKIYKVEARNTKWTKAKPLDTTFNNPRAHNANTAFSPDYKLMLISRCQAKNASDYTCELLMSRLVNNKWQLPEKLPEPVNLPGYSSTHANFGNVNGRLALFFSSDRPGGEGGLDIWYSYMKEDGGFESPLNVGKNINSPDDELSPWFVSDKNMLFFSSTYHKGLGGYDIFKSELSNGQFKEPENAGYPINSSYNDIYYSLNKTGTKIYLSSNRTGSMFEGKLNCCNDIYRFNIDTVKVKIAEPQPKKDSTVVVKEQMKLLVPLTLYFHNDEPDPRTKNITTSKNYETTFQEYQKLLPGYAEIYSKGLKGEERREAINEITTFFKDSLEAGLLDLRRFCDMLRKVLLKGETVHITFKGYCSPLASTDYNINLAKRRVSSLRNYFLQLDNGWFVRFVDNKNTGEGKIVFDEVDVGELPVSKASDDFKDKRNSIYSPAAASERKIQILAVSFEK